MNFGGSFGGARSGGASLFPQTTGTLNFSNATTTDSKPQTSLFEQPKPSGLFDQKPLFSLPQPPVPFGSNQMNQSTQSNQLNQLNQPNQISQQSQQSTQNPFQYLQSCYDQNSPNYPFRCFFYNRLPPNHAPVTDIIKPPQVSENVWKQVLDDNPQLGKYVPVMATGFEHLEERAKWQDLALEAHEKKLTELSGRLAKMQASQENKKSDSSGSYRKLLTSIQRQNDIAVRVLKVMRQVEVLRRAGRRLSENEKEMLRLLEGLTKKLSEPPIDSASIRMFAFQLNNNTDNVIDQSNSNGREINENAVLKNKDRIVDILHSQQSALSEIVEHVKQGLRDYDIMIHGYQN